MPLLGPIHVALAVISLVAGFGVLISAKGTPRHRLWGWAYAIGMIGLNVTALMIYRLFGRFGPFHAAALISLATVVAGLVAIVRRRPRKKWLQHHAYWMTWSYVGLCAAAAAEATTRLPASPFWWMVFLSTFAVVGAGRYLITSRVPRAIQGLSRRVKPAAPFPSS